MTMQANPVLALLILALLAAPAVAETVHESKGVQVETTGVGTIRTINHYHSHIGGELPLGSAFWVSVTMSSDESSDTVVPLVEATFTVEGCVRTLTTIDNTTTASRSARFLLTTNGDSGAGNGSSDDAGCRWAFRSTASNAGTQVASIASNGYVGVALNPTVVVRQDGGDEFRLDHVGGLEIAGATNNTILDSPEVRSVFGGVGMWTILSLVLLVALGVFVWASSKSLASEFAGIAIMAGVTLIALSLRSTWIYGDVFFVITTAVFLALPFFTIYRWLAAGRTNREE